MLRNEIELLENRRDSFKQSADLNKKKIKSDENKDIWDSITGIFASGGSKKEAPVTITSDELGKIVDLKVSFSLSSNFSRKP